MRLIDDLAGFGNRPILVLTGGDPLMRRDLFELAAYADASGAARFADADGHGAGHARRACAQAREAGVRRVAFSIDAADAATARPVPRLRRLVRAHDATACEPPPPRACRCRSTPPSTPTTPTHARAHGAAARTSTASCSGRSSSWCRPGAADALRDARRRRARARCSHWLVRAFARRSVRRQGHGGAAATAGSRSSAHARPRPSRRPSRRAAGAGYRFADGLDRPVKGVNDGRGFMFVSHLGEVMPSGFLPISAGNVRERERRRDLPRRAAVSRAARSRSCCKGKCGRCRVQRGLRRQPRPRLRRHRRLPRRRPELPLPASRELTPPATN